MRPQDLMLPKKGSDILTFDNFLQFYQTSNVDEIAENDQMSGYHSPFWAALNVEVSLF